MAAILLLWQWFIHHWDIVTIVIVFVGCLGLLIWRDISRKRVVPRPAEQTSTTEKEDCCAPNGPVDLRGDILELYFYRDNDPISAPSHVTVVMKVRIVNHGPQQATITHVGLEVRVGVERFMGSLVKRIPDSWRIRKRNEGLLGSTFEVPLEPPLGEAAESEIYHTGVPRIGWIAFEFYAFENIQFPNAQFSLLMQDSLGGHHCVQRKPMVYRKTGEIVITSEATAPSAVQQKIPSTQL